MTTSGWKRLLLSHSLLLLCGVGLGWGLCAWQGHVSGPEHSPRQELRSTPGRLTNPLLECEVFADQGLQALRPFKFQVEELLQHYRDEGLLLDGSVYFRDLNNGMWFGVNESVHYRPASLLKVPVMIAYYKLAERDPGLLGRKLRYVGGGNLTLMQGVSPADGIVSGRSYKVEELIYYMIAHSDNNAAQLLVENLDPRVFDQVLKDLDVNTNPADPEHFITSHAYAGFFRVLYNASYLTRDYSERALDILARSRFAEGIRAGLPPGQLAALKFGEWGDSADSPIVQLHEAGIIYHPKRPYLLAVMGRGQRGPRFEAMSAEISRLIFAEVERQALIDQRTLQ